MNAKIVMLGLAVMACSTGTDGAERALDVQGAETVIATPPREIVATDRIRLDEGEEDECEDLREEAEALVFGYSNCEVSGSCTVVDWTATLGPSCLLPFLCYSAVETSTDVEQLVAEAARINGDYRAAGCRDCVQAMCLDSYEVGAICEATLCSLTSPRSSPR